MKKSLSKILMILLVLALSLSVACKKPGGGGGDDDEKESGNVGLFLDSEGQFISGLNGLLNNLAQEDPYQKLNAEATIGVKLALFDGAKLDYDIRLATSIQPHNPGTSNSEVLVELTPTGDTKIILGLYIKDDLLYVVDGLTQKDGNNTFKVDIEKFALGQYLDDLPEILYSALSGKEKECLADGIVIGEKTYNKRYLVPLDTPIKTGEVGWVNTVRRNAEGFPVKETTVDKKTVDVPIVKDEEREKVDSIIDTIGGTVVGLIPTLGGFIDGMATLKGGVPDDDDVFPAGDYVIDLDLTAIGELIPTLLGMFGGSGSTGGIGKTLSELSGLLDGVLPLFFGETVNTDVLLGLFEDSESAAFKDAVEVLNGAQYPTIQISTKLEEDDSISSIGLYFNKEDTIGLDFSLKALNFEFNKAKSIVPDKVVENAQNKADGAIKLTMDLSVGTVNGYTLKADFYIAPGDFDLANATAQIRAVDSKGASINLEGGLYVDKNSPREGGTYATFLVFDMEGIYTTIGMPVPEGAQTKYKYEIFIDNILSAKVPEVAPVLNAEATEEKPNELFDTLNKVGKSITNILEVLKGFTTDGMKIEVEVKANDIINIIEALDLDVLPDYTEGAVAGSTLVINAENLANFVKQELCKFGKLDVSDANAIKVINALGKFNFSNITVKDLLFGTKDGGGLVLKLVAEPKAVGYGLTLEIFHGTTRIGQLALTLDIVEDVPANRPGVNLEDIYGAAADLNNKDIQTQLGDQFKAILDYLIAQIPAA